MQRAGEAKKLRWPKAWCSHPCQRSTGGCNCELRKEPDGG